MKAQLIESPEEHHLVLLEHRITELSVGLRSVRLYTWSLDGSAEVRLAAPFVIRLPSGVERSLDPGVPESLAPVLALVETEVRSLTMTRDGRLQLQLADGSVLEAGPDPRVESWVVQGGGVLEGMVYHCPPRGGVPWE